MPRKIAGSRVLPSDIGKYGGGGGSTKKPSNGPPKQTVKDYRRPGQG
jgi:hypothetical protein